MRKLSVFLVVLLLSSPLAAQSLRFFKPNDLSVASVASTAGKSVASDDCLSFRSGKTICVSAAGNDFVFSGGVILENGGRYYGSNGMSIGFGDGAGQWIYLGDPYGKGGEIVGPGGAVLVGNLARLTTDRIYRTYPLMTSQPTTLRVEFVPGETDGRGEASVNLPTEFKRSANLDPATRGNYQVIVLFENGGWYLVPQADRSPDHYVIRGGKANSKFVAIIQAIAEGSTSPRQLVPAPHALSDDPEPEDPVKVLRELQPEPPQ